MLSADSPFATEDMHEFSTNSAEQSDSASFRLLKENGLNTIEFVANLTSDATKYGPAFAEVITFINEFDDWALLGKEVYDSAQRDESQWEFSQTIQRKLEAFLEITVSGILTIYLPPGLSAPTVSALNLILDPLVVRPIAKVISAPISIFDNAYGRIPVAEALLDGKFDSDSEILGLAEAYVDRRINRSEFVDGLNAINK